LVESLFQYSRSNGGGVSPFEVIADDVVPHQVVGPQEAEGGREVLPLEHAATAQLHLAVLDHVLVDEDVQHAGFGEVQQRGEQRGRMHRLLAARGVHRQRGGQQRAADAEAQRIDLLAAADLAARRGSPRSGPSAT
jgi:hypothetical protein